MKKRHEWWREMYRSARDLNHLREEQLLERCFDCANNLSVNAGSGMVGIRTMDGVGSQWMQMWTEVLEEFQLRGIQVPGRVDLASHIVALERLGAPTPNMQPLLEKYRLGAKPYLLKFGAIEYMREGLARGKFQISAASSYDSYFRSHARRDRELIRTLTPHPKNPAVDKFADKRGLKTPAGKTISTLSIEAQTDYYLFSMCGAYSSRLYGDFHDEGSKETVCLVVHRPELFVRKLGTAIRGVLGTDEWDHKIGPVTYFDPVRFDPNLIDVTHCKPMRYAYQNEIRFTVIPKNPNLNLDPKFHIELGPLNDCAELVTLQSYPPLAARGKKSAPLIHP